MWRYGIGEPPKKKNKTDTSKQEKKNTYDTNKRTRVFQEQWLLTYKWLKYDEDVNKMYCTICKDSKSTDVSVFVSGSSNFKIDSIKSHETSAPHLKAMEAAENSKKAPGTSEASKALLMLHQQQKDRLEILFRIAHALAKNARPFTDFVWQCQLDQIKNVDIGQTYLNDKACKEFTSFIAKACLQNLVSDIKNSVCYSLIVDESTDTAIKQQLIIYVKFCIQGKQSVKFLNMSSLNRANADVIFATLKNVCTNVLNAENPFEKLLSFASDGAATMQGVRTGVAQKLSEQRPSLIKIHCMAHRLELAFKDTIKKFQDFSSVQDFLFQLFKFYHNSPTNREQLKEASRSLKLKELVPTRVGGTRWLPHLSRAFNNFFCLYKPLLLQLESCSVSSKTNSASVSRGFMKLLKCEHFMKAAIELSEVVSYLERVSLTLQERDITLFHAFNTVSTVIDCLTSLKQNDILITNKLDKFNLTPSTNSKRKGPNKSNKFPCLIDEIITQLNIRFPAINEHLLKVSKILSLAEWPKEHQCDFGKEEILAVSTEYDSILQDLSLKTEDLIFEWMSLVNFQSYWSEGPVTFF